jgi:hypothetical protein
MDLLAFAPTEDFRGMTGGTLAAPDGTTIDLKAFLDDTADGNQDGVLITADEYLKTALDADFRFERVDVPAGYAPHGEPADGLTAPQIRKMRKPELEAAYTAKFGIPAPDDATVPSLQYALDPETFPAPGDGVEGQTPLQPDGTPEAADDQPEED